MEPNKKCLVLNFPSLILRIHMNSNAIIFCETARQNDRIDDEMLQFMRLDNRFYMLPVEIVQIIDLLGNGVRERLRDKILKEQKPWMHRSGTREGTITTKNWL